MPNLLKPTDSHCPSCGVPNTDMTNESLWHIYYRIRDGRSTYEPLVYTQDDLYDAGYPDEDSVEAIKLSMERDMINRGLCPTCGRPDLRGVKPEDVMSEEEADEIWAMWQEQAAERRFGA